MSGQRTKHVKTSDQLRIEGNDAYKHLPSLSLRLQVTRLNKVQQLYQEALEAATTPLERSKACKNLAVAAKYGLHLVACDALPVANGREIVRMQVAVFQHYIQALLQGDGCQSASWLQELYDAVWDVLLLVEEGIYINMGDEEDDLAEWYDASWCRPDQRDVLQMLYNVVRGAGAHTKHADHAACIEAYVANALCKQIYNDVVTKLESDGMETNWMHGLSQLAGIIPLLEVTIEQAQRAGSEGVEEDAQELLDSMQAEMKILHSTQERLNAECMLEAILSDGADDVDIDAAWTVADMMKQSILYARGILEAEAPAVYSLACLYRDVLDMRDHALRLFKHVVQLGHAMTPRNVNSCLWFSESLKQVLSEQQRAVAAEEAAQAAERTAILEKLKDVLETIQLKAVKGAHELLKHVYDAHPPKNSEHTLTGTLSGDGLKATLKTAIVHYHPDKAQGHGAEWKVLCEEITKELSLYYNTLKG